MKPATCSGPAVAASGNSFLHRLMARRGRGIALIAEVKARTPAAGDLLRGREVEAIVRDFELAGVSAISVVTGHWFGGGPELLERAAACTRLPLLRKDFIVSRAAVSESKSLGASSVLLTAAITPKRLLPALVDFALQQELTPFVEVSSLAELQGLSLPPMAILALNNCNVREREAIRCGVERSLNLLASARSTGAGALVSASGIDSTADAVRLLDAGFDALLVGTALLQAPNLREQLQRFARLSRNVSP